MEQIGTVAGTDIVEDDVDGQMTLDPPISVTGIVVVEDSNSVAGIVEIMVDHPNSVAGIVVVEDVVGGEMTVVAGIVVDLPNFLDLLEDTVVETPCHHLSQKAMGGHIQDLRRSKQKLDTFLILETFENMSC